LALFSTNQKRNRCKKKKKKNRKKKKPKNNWSRGTKKPFDIRTLVGKNKTELAAIYKVSPSTFEKDIAAIKDQLDAERLRLRPGSKRGPQRFTLSLAQILVAHIGEPP
jgi:hypothetical protein